MAAKPVPEIQAQALLQEMRRQGAALDPRVEAAFRTVPRHYFLPNVSLLEVYSDRVIPIKYDQSGLLVSASSLPSTMALMLGQAQLQAGQNVLEIGTGSGYSAALLHHLVGPRGHVTTVELENDLARAAEGYLQRAGAGDVKVVYADGVNGYAPRAAYDCIFSSVGVWDVPPLWLRQLKAGGRLVVPIWLDGVQVSAAFVQQPDGSYYSTNNRPCAVIYMRGAGAGPVIQKQVGSTSMLVLADDVQKLDMAALHTLLSDDQEDCFLGIVLSPPEYWYGYQLYVMLQEPPGFIFAVYTVLGDQQAYGVTGHGIALFGPGSAALVPYDKAGQMHCYAGPDTHLFLHQLAQEWNAVGRPGVENLRLRLIPALGEPPQVDRGKLFVRRDHYLHVWMDEL